MGRAFQIKSFIRRKAGSFFYPAWLLLWALPFAAIVVPFFSFTGFLHTIASSRVLSILLTTLVQALLSTAAAFIIAVIPAYYAGRKKNFLSSLLDSTLFIPFFFPPVSAVISFSLIFSSRGLLAHAGFDPGVLYSLKGVIIAHAFYNSPLFVRYISSAMRQIPLEIIEEAQSCGASRWSRFRRIEFPLLAHSAARGALIVFIYCFMSFAIVLSIGGIGFYSIEAEISSVMRSTFDFSYALSLALMQLVLITAASYLSTRKRGYDLSGHRAFDTHVLLFPALVSIVYIIFEYSIVGVGLAACFFNFYDMRIDLAGFLSLFSAELNSHYPVIRSLLDSLAAAGIGSVISVSIAWILAKQNVNRSRLFVISSMGLSSAFISIALLYTNIITGISPVFLFLFGCVMNTVPVSYLFLSSHLSSFDKSLLEAAKICGAGPIQIFRRIELPLLLPVLIAALLQISMIIFGEFTIAYTMQIQDSFPLASVTAFSLEASRHAREGIALSGLMAGIVIAMSAGAGFLSKRLSSHFSE